MSVPRTRLASYRRQLKFAIADGLAPLLIERLMVKDEEKRLAATRESGQAAPAPAAVACCDDPSPAIHGRQRYCESCDADLPA
jgi:hypothetical protein